MYGLELLGDGAGRQRGPGPLQVRGESGRDDSRGVRGTGRRKYISKSWHRLASQCGARRGTHVSTILTFGDSTAASSFTRCGRLPVFCNCMMTPSTISSLMPSRSISFGVTSSHSGSSPSAPGDGGGVCSYLTGSRLGGGDIEGASSS